MTLNSVVLNGEQWVPASRLDLLLPHVEGAIALLEAALRPDTPDRELVVRAIGKCGDVRELARR